MHSIWLNNCSATQYFSIVILPLFLCFGISEILCDPWIRIMNYSKCERTVLHLTLYQTKNIRKFDFQPVTANYRHSIRFDKLRETLVYDITSTSQWLLLLSRCQIGDIIFKNDCRVTAVSSQMDAAVSNFSISCHIREAMCSHIFLCPLSKDQKNKLYLFLMTGRRNTFNN